MSKKIDLTGRAFGRWKVIGPSEPPNRGANKSLYWKCQCSCGIYRDVAASNLQSGASSSCGCLMSEKIAKACTKHGKSKSRVYKIWAGMIQRVKNPTRFCYKHYGGRGISISPEWLNFENFYKDMGDAPEGHSLERLNNDSDYCKENCVWATDTEQSRNSRNCKLNKNTVYLIKSRLLEKPVIEHLAKEFGVSPSLIRAIRNGEIWKDITVDPTRLA